jgi:polysaccharide biosynthesis transport protein
MPRSEGQSSPAPELTDYLRVIRERWLIVVLAVVIVMVFMLVRAVTSTPMYQASSQLVYQANNLDKALFGSEVFASSNEERIIDTGAAMIKTAPVAEAVKKELNSTLPASALSGMIGVTPSVDTNVLQIDATSDDPQLAADVANAFATQFVAFRQNADKQTVAAARDLVKAKLDSLSSVDAGSAYGLMLKEKYESLEILEAMQTGGFTVAQAAVPPASPFSPRPLRSGLIGLAGGLVLGLGIAFLLNRLDRRLKGVKAVEAAFGLPVLATLPDVGNWLRWSTKRRTKHVVGFRSHPGLLEAFRSLRSCLQYFDVEQKVKTILVTSGLPGEGKTTTVINLGLSLVLAGFRVIIVEADLRRPMVSEYLDVDNRVGMSTLLAGNGTIADVLRPVNTEALLPKVVRDKAGKGNGAPLPRTLFCLPSGPLPPNPAELLGSDRMMRLLEELRLNQRVDYVLIDTPPILSVADALVIGNEADVVIIACRVNWTTLEEAEEVSEQLRRAGPRVVGVVAGGVKPTGNSYRKRSYYHY